MLIYLKHALAERGSEPDNAAIEAAVREGALLSVRPGEVFLKAPKRLIFVTVRRLKIAETINSTITILGKCWTLPDCPILPIQLTL